jgi:agarase
LLIEHYTAGGKPILISEWSYRAADSGLPNTYPPIYPTVTTQKERAKKFKTYVNALLERDYFVGHHWFIHADQPPEGRFDGENNNFGLVSEADVPYQLLVETSAAVANEIYRPFWEK